MEQSYLTLLYDHDFMSILSINLLPSLYCHIVYPSSFTPFEITLDPCFIWKFFSQFSIPIEMSMCGNIQSLPRNIALSIMYV